MITLDIPGHVAGIGHNLHRFRSGDEALLLLVKVPRVGEGHGGARLLDYLDRVLRRWFALGVKMFDFDR